MKTGFVWIAASLPLAVLAWMAGEREWILQAGRPVWLRTAPLDPRDIFRGDYVRLDYEISQPWGDQIEAGLKNPPEDDAPIYTALQEDEGGLASPVRFTLRRPEDGLFIRGRVDNQRRWSGEAFRIRYGIEALFVEQGRGLELEEGLRRQDGIQVPMEVETRLSPGGVAVLRGYRWSPIGMGIDVEALPEADRLRTVAIGNNAPNVQLSYRITLKLFNASQRPLGIVELPDHRSFILKPARGTEARWRPVDAGETHPPPADGHVRVLEPGQVHVVRIDLSEPRWALRNPAGEVLSMGNTALNWGDWFRLEYRPPPAAECASLREAAGIWHGRLPSRAVSGTRNRD